MSIPTLTDTTSLRTSHTSRRAFFALAIGAIGSVGVPAGLAAAKPKSTPARRRPTRRRRQRRPRSKVVTRTFHNPSPIAIIKSTPDPPFPAVPYPSVITVTGLKRGRLLDLDVTLRGFSHTWSPDVNLLLVAPTGRGAVIMSDVGPTTAVTNVTVVLDDQAPTPLAYGASIAGRFQPANDPSESAQFPAPASESPYVALATFTGINPNGAWRLFVVDDGNDDTGSIVGGWALTIKARVRV